MSSYLLVGPLRAKLDMSSKVSNCGLGQPLTVVADPGSNMPLTVLLCENDTVPDYVGGLQQCQKATAGSIHAIGEGAPISLAGTVIKGDKLMVSNGGFIKATAGKKSICCAAASGVAGDVISAATIPVVA